MFRIIAAAGALLLILTLMLCPAETADADDLNNCLKCHEAMYVKDTSYPNTHEVIKEGCDKCHYLESRQDNSRRISSRIFLREIILGLGNLSTEDMNHLVQIEARDEQGSTANPLILNTGKEVISRLPAKSYELTEISDIRVEQIERKIFAKAVVSWSTDVPTASTVSYGTSPKDRNILSVTNVYKRKHTAVLTGLRHKRKYSFTITSVDMNGNKLRSDEMTFDTSKAFDLTNKRAAPENTPDIEPEIEQTSFMTIGEKKETFVRISSNKPVRLRLTVTESDGEDPRPCENFVLTRHSTIKVCTECHVQNASHPVGVRSKNPQLKIPVELPVIENGVITCVTCHFAHGSETEYYLRIKFSKEICVKCHPTQYL